MGKLRSFLNFYSRLSPGRYKLSPPYNHITQIGDPILRKIAEKVDGSKIDTEEIKQVVIGLRRVMDKYKCVGLAAPQIGVNKRIIALEYKQEYNLGLSNEKLRHKQISIVPFTVFINPSMKVLDYTRIVHPEGCESLIGFTAEVPRYQAVQLTGYNEKGEPVTKDYEGWAARMAQHEIDHLDGKFYIDIMNTKTFACSCWEEVNYSRGKLEIPFYPS